MVGVSLVNAAAFISGNYLTKYLSGHNEAAMEKEKERHDRAQEAYQASYAKYTRDGNKRFAWIAKNAEMKAQAKLYFTNTDFALKLYNQTHSGNIMTPLNTIFITISLVQNKET